MKNFFIERQNKLLRIAVKDNNKLMQCYIEEESEAPLPGEIYYGIVRNVVPAIKCAFVDIGWKKNCYVYLDKKFNNTRVKKDDEIIVEIVKEDLGGKGPKATNAITVPGRYLVLVTLNNEISFSKSIANVEFKEGVRTGLSKQKDVGVMIRTAAEKASLEDINSELEELDKIYRYIVNEAQYSAKPKLLYSSGGVFQKVLRDNLDSTECRVIVNNEEDYNSVKKFINDNPDVNAKGVLHEEDRTLFDYYGIEKEMMNLRNDKVYLSCGGYIIIQKTEAMYVIDVNSGKNVKGNSMEKTSLVTNLDAAEEIARQIRLRNLSGIIVVDFIDMNDEGHKKEVFQKLEEGFKGDKSKSVIYPFTELNLVQIARRRVGKSFYEYIEEDCRVCHGTGKKIKLSYISMLIRNEVIRIGNEHGIKDIYIELNNIYEKEVTENVLEFVKDIDSLDKRVYVNYVSNKDLFKVEPLLFVNQISNNQIYKIYG